MALKVGEKAPDFTLPSFTPSAEVKNISLSDSKGKNVVLLFYPMSFTAVCTAQMYAAQDNFDMYQDFNADVYGISVDGTFVQKAFAKQNNITYPLLSDFNKEVIKKYDVVHPEFAHGQMETAKRAAYVIGKDGIIKYVEVTATPGDQIKFDELNNALRGI